MELIHDKVNCRFTLKINDQIAKVDYVLKENTMLLTYAQVPKSLSGQGYGKVLVEKTFEKLTSEGYKAVAICGFVKTIAKRSDKWKNIIQH
ncbi:acetyltransferase [Pseudalgibacter alginicilyticus]|uniref:Acetyltransferase n=1 Tax=Pseudalgibacter alginicilyticus TaxID=1736674 RepID=A0A0P0D9H3_9FLAO|nr:GNAT family N-acetyltransferase [Pseudalgibacter alginicilyticus]ALJ06802.1 acetyltransferase [Pseudalgibacter alginicilyticus]